MKIILLKWLLRQCYWSIIWLTFLILSLDCDGSNPVNIEKAPKITHNTRIDEDQTWTSSQTHIIAERLIVENATLTIEPGTKIELHDSASLIVAGNGSLRAIGTETDSIRFVAQNQTGNNWGKLYLIRTVKLKRVNLNIVFLKMGELATVCRRWLYVPTWCQPYATHPFVIVPVTGFALSVRSSWVILATIHLLTID